MATEHQGEPPFNWHPDHLKLAVEAAGVALWAWNVDDDHFTMDPHGFELWGLPRSGAVTFEELSERMHPADRDRVRAAFAATPAGLTCDPLSNRHPCDSGNPASSFFFPIWVPAFAGYDEEKNQPLLGISSFSQPMASRYDTAANTKNGV
jgi:hypothetical protein